LASLQKIRGRLQEIRPDLIAIRGATVEIQEPFRHLAAKHESVSFQQTVDHDLILEGQQLRFDEDVGLALEQSLDRFVDAENLKDAFLGSHLHHHGASLEQLQNGEFPCDALFPGLDGCQIFGTETVRISVDVGVEQLWPLPERTLQFETLWNGQCLEILDATDPGMDTQPVVNEKMQALRKTKESHR
jgi:hypothetical protein